MSTNFLNLYAHDFARVAIAAPVSRIADPAYNAAQTIALATQAAEQGAALVAFPNWDCRPTPATTCSTSARCSMACLDALEQIVVASLEWKMALVVGAPLRVEHQLYNCAVVIAGGQIQGVVPKSYLPNYGEFYEARQFSSGDYAVATEIDLLGERVQFGSGLLFEVADLPLFKFHVEICEDVWVPIPPSSFAALAGATVLVNLSASNALVGKAGYRNQLVSQQSARCIAAYLYTSAGGGESTTDLAWDGQGVICENGELLAEAQRLATSHADLCRHRPRTPVARAHAHEHFAQSVQRHAAEVGKFRTVFFQLEIDQSATLALKR
jgi:NAD+ synthase (glutamine-hydrolysing)